MGVDATAPHLAQASHAQPDAEDGALTLQDLEADVVAAILLKLSPRDVAICACTSSKLRAQAEDDRRVWLHLCQREFGQHTDVSQWLSDGSDEGVASPSQGPGGGVGGSSCRPSTYRQAHGQATYVP